MTSEDSLQFVQDRLRPHAATPLTRTLRLDQRRPRVTRRFAVEVAKGATKVFARVDETVQVHLASGGLWITHDGDCKDVILSAGETHRADRCGAMHLFAMQDCVLELEFEDDAIPMD
jgi:hypothetical protein